MKDYSKKFKIEERLIKELIFSGILDLFNELIKIYPDNPILIITTLLETTTALRRDGNNVENIQEKDYVDMFTLLKKGEMGKEAIEDMMILKADSPKLTMKEVKEKLNIESISEEELTLLIKKIIDENENIIKDKAMKAMGPLMGDLNLPHS